MAIDIYTIYTARELREALAKARTIVRVGISQIIHGKTTYKKDALECFLKEAEEMKVEDALEYIYRGITKLAWLSREIDRFDAKEKKSE